MSYYAVTREAGSGWTDGKPPMEQAGIADHAGFMNDLAEEGFVLCAGPLAGTENRCLRALLIIDAESEAHIKQRLADDPWAIAGRLQITSVEPWSMFVGAERLHSGARRAAQPREPPSDREDR